MTPGKTVRAGVPSRDSVHFSELFSALGIHIRQRRSSHHSPPRGEALLELRSPQTPSSEDLQWAWQRTATAPNLAHLQVPRRRKSSIWTRLLPSTGLVANSLLVFLHPHAVERVLADDRRGRKTSYRLPTALSHSTPKRWRSVRNAPPAEGVRDLSRNSFFTSPGRHPCRPADRSDSGVRNGR